MKAKLLAFFVYISIITSSVNAQNEVSLHIGDPAPPVKYSKWLKGKPVASFTGNQLYVLEFWATWCGPCKQAMPHLTKLQSEYEGKASFIGIDVWEGHGSDEKPFESYLPAVEKFVKGNDVNMGYAVVADNNDQYMGNKWLKAAGINGIPSTFIIKDQKIIWIGHPVALDTILPKILNGSYNMQEFKLAYEKRVEASLKRDAGMKAAWELVQAPLKTKDYKKAFEAMEKAKVDQPILKISMDNLKFTTLLNEISEKEAIAFAEEWQKDFKNAPSYILMGVNASDKLSKSTYIWAAKNYENLATSSTTNPMTYTTLATTYSKAGDYKNAVLNQEKAIDGARTALREGKMIGSIMDYTVTEYEEKLKEYKKANKS